MNDQSVDANLLPKQDFILLSFSEFSLKDVLENTIDCKTPCHFLLDKIVCEYLY